MAPHSFGPGERSEARDVSEHFDEDRLRCDDTHITKRSPKVERGAMQRVARYQEGDVVERIGVDRPQLIRILFWMPVHVVVEVLREVWWMFRQFLRRDALAAIRDLLEDRQLALR